MTLEYEFRRAAMDEPFRRMRRCIKAVPESRALFEDLQKVQNVSADTCCRVVITEENNKRVVHSVPSDRFLDVLEMVEGWI
jgi:hypothetical protein